MWAEPTPTEGFAREDSGLSPAWAVKSPALAQTAPPCPQEANVDLATATLESLV